MVSQERDSKRIAIYIHTYSFVDMRSNLYEQLLHCSLTQICVRSVNINNLKKIKHRVVSEYQWCSRGFESIGGRQTCLYRNLFTTHRKTSTKNIKTILCSIACMLMSVILELSSKMCTKSSITIKKFKCSYASHLVWFSNIKIMNIYQLIRRSSFSCQSFFSVNKLKYLKYYHL